MRSAGDVRLWPRSGMLRGRDGRWLEHVATRFGAFRTARAPDFVVRYERDAVDARQQRDAVDVHASPRGFAILGPGFGADVDLVDRAAVVRGPEGESGVDCLVKRLVPHLDPEALVLHAALARDGASGVLLAGPSGAGKSTIARLIGDRALCDELALVRRTVDGLAASALPLWTARPGAVGLRAVFALRHAPEHAARRLPQAEAVRVLAAQVVWPLYCAASMSSQLLLFEELSRSVPLFDLGFAPRADVWATICEEVDRV